ncbi:protein-L-isoaspartate O-methyltransferase [Maribacter chungangensis]|uniref:Protein-L-isoaspartate O-methyltransferase n=1 Tax=Maribacter chungangensis TaxID=1069117 RepID=A0ABW3B3K1_9FLAO
MIEKKITHLQNQIIDSYNQIFHWSELREEIRDSFFKIKRHLFVDKYYDNDAVVNFSSTTEIEKLEKIYSDYYLPILIAKDGEILSSLSQPSLVLYMLNISNINKGSKVLEIGTASGWNASIISDMVGNNGQVDTIEIDRNLTEKAKSRFKRLGYNNIHVFCDDNLGVNLEGPYDTVIFTVGTYDIPKEYYSLIKENGTLILVLKNPGNGDTLYALRKEGNSFIANDGISCGFVQLKGKYSFNELNYNMINLNPVISEILLSKESHIRKYWFGGNKLGNFESRSSSFKSFLSIYDSYFISGDLTIDKTKKIVFGIYNKDEQSVALFYDDKIHYSKATWAYERLLNCMFEWVKLGMPIIPSFKLEIRFKEEKRSKVKGEIVKVRDENYYYFSI